MRNLRTIRLAFMVERRTVGCHDVEAWHRQYKLAQTWRYCQRHPSTLWARVCAGDD